MSNPLKFFQRTWQVVAEACSPLREEPAPTVSLTALEDRVLYDASPLAGLVTDVDKSIDTLEDIDGHINDFFLEESAGAEVSFESPLSSDEILAQPLFEPARQLFVIDDRVDDIEALFADILENSHARSTFDIVRINDESSGIEQISDALSSGAKYGAVHIVSHGSEASLQLGSLELNQDNIGAHTAELSGWASGLTLDADILLYGCDVAGNDAGEFFVEQLSSITGADVAASDDLTGHVELGGNWNFEYFVGDVQTDVAFSVTAQANWHDTLATFTVTTTADVIDGGDGFLSLREAIIAANDNAEADTVILGTGTYTIADGTAGENASATGDLDITSDITIQGDGAQDSMIAATLTTSDRLFDVRSSGDLTLQGLTLQGGSEGSGGAVSVDGTLQATDVVFDGNSASANGGAIYASGDVTLNRVALINNSSTNLGGAIFVVGTATDVTINNSTISGNDSGSGGGIQLQSGTLTIDHSTIANNDSTTTGGGLKVIGSASATVSNSIFADNTSGSGGKDIDGTIASGGHNIIEDDNGAFTPATGDQQAVDPGLNALALVDGTYVHTFDTTSIAYNAATGSTETVDQRGFARDSSPDIGAYELQVLLPDLVTTASQVGGLSINEDGGNDIYLLADDGIGSVDLAQISFESQFRTSTTGDDTTLISYASSSSVNEFLVYFNTNGGAGRVVVAVAGTFYSSTAIDYNTLRDGDSHSLSVTWNSSGGVLKIYADGILVDSTTGFKTGSSITSGGTLLLGQEQDSIEGGFDITQSFKGTLADTRLFSTVRTDQEIEASYRSDLPYDEFGLIANWKFDQLSSDGVIVDTVSGNNLTVKHTSESGFTASEASLTFTLDENAIDGTVVGQVAGVDHERTALIASLLADDPDLRYSAETDKFYKANLSTVTSSTAQTNSGVDLLNGVGGQLATIRSAAEQEVVAQIASDSGATFLWIGGSDATVDGEWRWQTQTGDDDQFWQGEIDGYNPDNAYANWRAGRPDNGSGSANSLLIRGIDGEWDDDDGSNSRASITEWNADDVLDATQAITYAINAQTVAGAFAIDASTGEITVADGSKLDFETTATHTLTVRTTDADNNTYDENFTISLSDLAEENEAVSALSSGIELNTDGGNDSYLIAENGGEILGGTSELTIEVSFATTSSDRLTLVSYLGEDNRNDLAISLVDNGTNPGTATIIIDNVAETSLSGIDYDTLRDGERHDIALSWDNSNGDWRLYVDGVVTDSGTGLNQNGTLNGSSTMGELVFGQDQDTLDGGYDPTDVFSGTLYDARIWNEVRTADEIQSNLDRKFDSGSLPDGLVANWQFDGFDSFGET